MWPLRSSLARLTLYFKPSSTSHSLCVVYSFTTSAHFHRRPLSLMASTSVSTGNSASGNASSQNPTGRASLRPSASTRVPDNRRPSPADGGPKYVVLFFSFSSDIYVGVFDLRRFLGLALLGFLAIHRFCFSSKRQKQRSWLRNMLNHRY